MSSLEDIWNRLSVDGEGADGLVRLRHPAVRECAAYAARRITDGLESVVIEVRTDALPPASSLPQSAGMHMEVTPLTPGRSGRSRIILTLTDARYRDVFKTLAEDVVAGLVNADDEPACVRHFFGRVNKWQAFLRQHGPDGLTAERRVGLYGELRFLRDVLLKRIDADTAVKAWKGCSKASHDFQLARGSVEIKTTRAVTPIEIHVSNVKQLDDAGLPSLFVYLFSVDENDGGGESLPELIRSVRNLLSGISAERFEEGLSEQGYLDVHQERYITPRYTSRTTRWFHVREGFPRLLPADLPEGIGEVSYSVSIAACAPFACGEEEAVLTIIGE